MSEIAETAVVYPGTYEEFLWSRKNQAAAPAPGPVPVRPAVPKAAPAAAARQTPRREEPSKPRGAAAPARSGAAPQQPAGVAVKARPEAAGTPGATDAPVSYEDRKRQDAEDRRIKKALAARKKRIEELEGRAGQQLPGSSIT